jgi:pyridoxamine 5'-phosphate oxidase
MSDDRIWTGQIRREYGLKTLSRHELSDDPIVQFRAWFEEGAPTVLEPNAMALATSDDEGRPSVRMVLMKAFDHLGIVFATSYLSRKSCEILENPSAALLFYWPSLERQVRVVGKIERTDVAESDEIFRTRSPKSQIAARVSLQSAPVVNRQILEEKYFAEEKLWAGKTIDRPDTWGGFRVIPSEFEFWQGGEHRLHDRFAYLRTGSEWAIERLQP